MVFLLEMCYQVFTRHFAFSVYNIAIIHLYAGERPNNKK